jgi:methylmalonyl-CoA mutase
MKNQFFSEFNSVSPEDWDQALSKALKGQKPSEKLHYHDLIEQLDYKAYYHPEDSAIHTGSPGVGNYLRGGKYHTNDWEIVNVVPHSDPSTMNKQCLDLLMKGATALRLDLGDFSVLDCTKLIENIGLQFIITTFIYQTEEQFRWINSLISQETRLRIHAYSHTHKDTSEGLRTRLIDGTEVARLGGNATQEIAYLLSDGHAQLHAIMQEGKSVDEAASQLKFKTGLSANYFIQIAKQRAFRALWSEIVDAYHPEHSCSKIAYLEGETLFINKSAKDPYTNLLRQTTEALSGVVGGLDELTILPYDWRCKQQDWARTNRLATNIALILKEESYLAKVVDPSGGAFAVEKLTEDLAQKAWSLFQTLEAKGLEHLRDAIAQCAALRQKNLADGQHMLIGINQYFNPEDISNAWQPAEELTWGKELILERDTDLSPALHKSL